MLTSLFGDLGRARHPKDPAQPGDAAFAATSLSQSVAAEINASGQIVDRHSHDLVVSGSPAQAIREHFAATRADLESASALITLLDPAGVWASAVIKALSDAGGRPIDRLHLREHSTLRTLATIERTTLVRRHEDTLRIMHADVRAPGSENAEIPVVLMERSQMTTVIIGPMQPHAIDALLDALRNAVLLPTWSCPTMLFMLPPNAVWIANKISAVGWPSRLRVHVLSESMTGASSVWNAMLGVWTQVKAQPAAERGSAPAVADEPAAAPAVATERSGVAEPALAATLDEPRARRALAALLTLDGLLGCAIVDSTSGLVLAREGPEAVPFDIELAAAACTQMLRAQRLAARSMGLDDAIDEVMTSAGARQQIVRTLTKFPSLFLFVLLDKHRTNLALARFQLMEVERGLR
ncbi:MAG TPA: hypothetical protein VNU71_05030 [Burkholderiaceae bacterium]|nr:hypothetical protein [Burkholderiaceae bacterium]